MLTDKQRSTLKKLLLEQKIQIEKHDDNLSLEQGSLRDTTAELSTLDNHPADLGTELYEREKDMALKVHEDAELAKVDEALEAISKGTYGVCDECGEDIPFERLEAVPYTTRCVEHADKNIPQDRPAEEDVLHPPLNNSFAERRKGEDVRNFEDSFQEVAQYGTSETPSDFTETMLTSMIYMTMKMK
jgi:YteA family regulatory protein